LVYGLSPIDKPRCGLCGTEFVVACVRCGTPLPETFASPAYVGTGELVNPPQRPANCTNCGKPFPWNSKPRRFFAWAQAIPGKIWTEFKSLSALHIILLLVILLVIIGAITWRDLVDILKGVSNK
jgi:hypothetical protein